MGLLSYDSPFTVELWARTLPGSDGQFALLGDYDNLEQRAIGRPDRNGFGKPTGSIFGIRADMRQPNIDNFRPGIDAGKWLHIAAANELEGLSLYINGKRYRKRLPIKWKPSPINLQVGQAMYKASNLQVEIGYLRISSTCLYSHHFEPPLVFEKRPDTLVLLDFAHPQGKTITDLSGHQHHGTIRGASWLVRDDDSVTMPATKLVVAGPFGPRLRHARRDRQEVKFEFPNLQVYTRQLDFFKIELGAAGGKPNVDYAFNLTKDRPDTREGSGGAEKRLYMTWKVGELSKFDKTILARGGIQTAGRVVLQFYPEETEHRLALVELQNAKSEGVTSVKEIRKTFFGVRAKGGGYEFFVEGQQFRPAPHE